MLSTIRGALACLLALAVVQPAVAQTNWPDKPVKIVVGVTAGSSTDVTARMFAQKFSEAWGQPVIVENITGNLNAFKTTVVGIEKKVGDLRNYRC